MSIPYNRFLGLIAILYCLLLNVSCTSTDLAAPVTHGTSAKRLAQEGLNTHAVDDKTLPFHKIAVFAPLSGPYAAVGQAMVDAAKLAFPQEQRDNIKIYDTKGQAAEAINMMNQAMEDGVRMIIGPLFAAETQAITPLAVTHHVTVLSLSNDTEFAHAHIIPLGLNAIDSIIHSIDYANSVGIKQFYALLPANSFGKRAEKFIRKSIVTHESTLIKSEFYVPGDDESYTLAIESIRDALNASGADNTAKTQALLIPEGGNTLSRLVHMLSLYGINKERIQFLGSVLWDPHSLHTEPLLHHAWYSGSISTHPSSFYEIYFSHYKQKPTTIAELSYDAATLSIEGTRYTHGTFDEINQYLHQSHGFHGLLGGFKILPNGYVERLWGIYEVTAEGRIIKQEPLSGFPHSEPAPIQSVDLHMSPEDAASTSFEEDLE